MTMFWIGAAGLVALAWLMVWPAWRARPAPADARDAQLAIYREQLAALDRDLAAGTLDAEQHALARQELQRRVLDETQAQPQAQPSAATGSRKTLVIVGIALPLFALGVYAAIGNLAGLAPQAAAQAGRPEVSPAEVEAMLTKLHDRLEKGTGKPEADLQGWSMLGRSYAALQRFPEADKAYARALALAPDDAQLLADRADVLAMLQGQSLEGEPDRLIAKALTIDPMNLKALALAGASAFQRKDLATARTRWQQARSLAPAGSEFAAGLDQSLAQIQGTVAAAAPPSAPVTTASPQAATRGSARITGRVTLSPALAARAAPTDTVFIFARAAEGPRMPLAILKRSVSELPIVFTLDDSMAMSPEMKLSKFDRVVVGARISRSGNAMPQPGDLRGESSPTATRADGLQLVIDGVQP